MASKAEKKRNHRKQTVAKAAAVLTARQGGDGVAVQALAGAGAGRARGGLGFDAVALARAEERRLRAAGLSRSEAEAAAEVAPAAKGHRRIKGRDGLLVLEEAGWLTGVFEAGERTAADWFVSKQRAMAGLAYRKMFEDDAAVVRSQLGGVNGSRGGSGTTDGLVAGAMDSALARLMLGEIDRQVAMAWPKGRELDVLRAIAGEGRSARSLTTCGGKGARYVAEALNRALDKAWETIRKGKITYAVTGD